MSFNSVTNTAENALYSLATCIQRFRRRCFAISCDTREGRLQMPLPQTEIPGRLQSQLAGRGIRLTAPRRAILSVIETATKHLDASQILRKARTVDASVNRSTVYRTLDLLNPPELIADLDLIHLNSNAPTHN